jgi:hypothetical protein
VFVRGPAVASTALNPTFSVLTNTSGYAASNISTDPLLADAYCNGSRVTPEFPSVINPPSPKTLLVAATVDEGNNYVTLRYGPLYQSKPTSAAGTAYASFGDLHLGATSPAKDSGTPVDAVTHDVDADQRGPGATGPNKQYDRGADEIRYPAPTASLSGSALSFGKQPVNTTSAPLVLTVTNTGDAALTFNAPHTISGNFAIVPGAGTTCNVPVNQAVAVGASCTISVTFTPASQGDKTGTLTLHDNAGTGTQTIALGGTGTQVTATFTSATLGSLSAGGGGGGPSLDFGNLSGQQSSIVTITVNNGPVSFTSAIVTNGNGGSAFSKTAGGDTCSNHTVLDGTTCTVTLGFTAPSGRTNRSGTLTLTDTATGSPQTLRLSGQ